jgi:hypothetical protein
MRRSSPLALLIVLVAVVTSACGDDDSTGATDDVSPEAAADEVDNADESEDDFPAEDDATADDSATSSGGSVTIDGATYGFDPTVQCSFFPDGVIFIAGNATSEPDVEISFDAFEAEDYLLSVTVGSDEWTSSSVEATVGDSTVSGTAVMTSMMSADEAEASFEFSC